MDLFGTTSEKSSRFEAVGGCSGSRGIAPSSGEAESVTLQSEKRLIHPYHLTALYSNNQRYSFGG